MKELLIESKGIRTDQYFIPPFELREGDLVLIHLDCHVASSYVEEKLIAILAGKEKHKNVRINKPHTFVKHFRESRFKDRFFPATVGEYLSKNANLKSEFANKIYEIDWINKDIKIKTLAGNPRKLISLYSVLSKTNNIIFDLAAQDFEGIEHAAKIVKDEIGNNGSAVLIEQNDYLKKYSTKYIKIQWFIDLDEYEKKFKF
ncbi:hypothetical protein [Flavobacterium sp. LM4]|uniref:hypothetical protein n=1 Tax=Flavobacterium sp. LM4 TaxID=1938609 RepID=UPI0009936947|nr:hypothetical protein [Flavobacterium sp. LM4]OOV17038.1 hypothetical protein BXU10_18980 [Flavobacterium sp. LM4]